MLKLREFEFDGPKEKPVTIYVNGKRHVGYEMVIISQTKKSLSRDEWRAIWTHVVLPELGSAHYYYDDSIGSILVFDRNAAVKLKLKFG